MDQLGELVREPEKYGWRLGNLMKLADGMWHCAIVGDPGRSHGGLEYSAGKTPEEAVRTAIKSMQIAAKLAKRSPREEAALQGFLEACQRFNATHERVFG